MEDVDSANPLTKQSWCNAQCMPKDVAVSRSSVLEFGVSVASKFRFRYLSEITKKTYSPISGENNQAPTLKINAPCKCVLQLDLLTQDSSAESPHPHFNTFYEVSKLPQDSSFKDEKCFISIGSKSPIEIKLNFLGIRKLKQKEALPKIKEKNPQFTKLEVDEFYMKNKDTVKLRALLLTAECTLCSIVSNTIQSQTSKENKAVKIQQICPKTVADYNECLIIILQKKVTEKCVAFLKFDDMLPIQLQQANENDKQTFIYNLPPYNSQHATTAKVRIECSDYYDEKPIRFLPLANETRKRKPQEYESRIGDLPLKKSAHEDRVHYPMPESGDIAGHSDTMEYDGARIESHTEGHISGNESFKDSGVYSGERLSPELSDKEEDDCDDDDGSFDDSYGENDGIEFDGVRRRRNRSVANLEPINFPPPKRDIESHLFCDRTDKVSKKIFSEVARMGHDYAFGKEPEDLFARMENQLPVVFTLQDDVGDTPLNNAILKGNTAHAEHILKVLIKECEWALDLVNSSGHTALILAPACDVPATLVEKLLDAGCKVEAQDYIGKTAIAYAIEYKNVEALRVLLEHIQKKDMASLLQRQKDSYQTYLQVAVLNSFDEGVRMLLELKSIKDGSYMVDVNELALMNSETALHIAVERQVGLGIIKLLLQRPDIDVNIKKDGGMNALEMAKKMEIDDVAEELQLHVDKFAVNFDVDDNERMHEEVTPPHTSHEVCPIVESNSIGVNLNGITTLIDSMRHLSLKGDNRTRIIDLLLNGDVTLNMTELEAVVKPGFRSLLRGLSAPSDVANFLNKNCLPNSIGQLIERLNELKRFDMIDKVSAHFIQ